MLKFITLQTNNGAWQDPDGTPYNETRRKVSIAYTDKRTDVCNLLGNLTHQTEFTRADLVTFARDVLTAFDANGGEHDNG